MGAISPCARIQFVTGRMAVWSLVRLELAQSPAFPGGSASRAFMLRVPLDAQGLIDESALAQAPAMATVRRFWPNEPDQMGQLVRQGEDWSFTCALGDESVGAPYLLRDQPLRVGEFVTLSDPGGPRWPFRVVQSRPDGVRRS